MRSYSAQILSFDLKFKKMPILTAYVAGCA